MIKRTVLSCIAGIFLISCVSVDAKQPSKVGQIEGFTPATTSISNTTNSVSGLQLNRKHVGPVRSLSVTNTVNSFFSAGDDGFISCHRIGENDEIWQVSDIPLKKIVVNPDGNLIAIYETDGFSVHRISVWDWKNKKRIYAKRFRDSIISLTWSSRGKYLLIGNTSIEGITILEGSTGEVQSFFKTAPGIVSLSVTGSTETSMITFGPSGRIVYTDITSKTERASYQGEKDLDQSTLFNSSTRIAGYKENTIFVLDATNGKTLNTFQARKPVMATSDTDTLPVWFEEQEAGVFTVHTGSVVSPTFTFPDKSTIMTAISLNEFFIVGTSTGMVYSIEKKKEYTIAPVTTALVENTIRTIDDMISDGSRLFFLSSGSIFISSGPGNSPIFAFDGVQANRLELIDDGLLCWSSNRSDPLMRITFDGESRIPLYQPKDRISSLTITGDKIAIIEGNSLAIILEAATGKSIFTYSGAGLQDALMVSQDRLVLSKSSTMRSPYPLILIDTRTGETVPLPVSGELCFGIKRSVSDNLILNGFIVKAGDNPTTELITVTLNTQTIASSTMKTEAVYADEDLVASILPTTEGILTNLGKSNLAIIQKKNGKQLRFERGYALPHKAVLMDQYIVSLNYDGSLTWFNKSTNTIVLTSSITEKGLWFEQ